MADYRYLMVDYSCINSVDSIWRDNMIILLKKWSAELNFSLNLHFSRVIDEAAVLVCTLRRFYYCPYFIEDMKKKYVWPEKAISPDNADNFRILVFVTAYLMLDNIDISRMHPFCDEYIGGNNPVNEKFKTWRDEGRNVLESFHLTLSSRLYDINYLETVERKPWDKITDNFNAEVMVKVLDRYMTFENKNRVLDYIEAFCLIRPQFAYMLDAERPGSIMKFREWIKKDVKISPDRVGKGKNNSYS